VNRREGRAARGGRLVLAHAIQSGKVKSPRRPGEDGKYEAPHMDRLGL
jgi:hypothetical protein